MRSMTRWEEGSVSFELGGELDQLVRAAALAATDGALAVLEEEANVVATAAREAWYGPNGVKLRTGKSGDIVVVTTVTPTEIRVAIGSRDVARAKYVHRPGPLSRIKVPATRADFVSGAALASPKGKKIQGRGVKEIDNPKASDGKFLLQELIGKPARAMLKRLEVRVGPAIVERIGRGGR